MPLETYQIIEGVSLYSKRIETKFGEMYVVAPSPQCQGF
jgi:hypothetical protein